MKKILCILLALALVTPLFATGIYAEGDPTITVGSVTATAGEEVAIPVTVSNNPGFNTFVLKVEYDKTYLKEPSFELAGDIAGLDGTFEAETSAVWVYSSDYTGDGDILTLKFRVADAPDGTEIPVTVSYTPGNISNISEDEVNFTVVPGKVTVASSDSPALVVGQVDADPGATVDVPVYVRMNPGFSAFVLAVDYDGTLLEKVAYKVNVDGIGGEAVEAEKMVWLSPTDYAEDGLIATLTFRVPETAKPGSSIRVGVRYDEGNVSNRAEGDVVLATVDGYVNINEPVTGARFEVGNVKCAPGEEVTVPVALVENPGVAVMRLFFDYDDTYAELTDASVSDALGGAWFFGGNIAWYGNEDYAEDGDVIFLKFAISEDAPDGTEIPVSVSYGNGDVANYDERPLDFACVPGTITVEREPEPEPEYTDATMEIGAVEGSAGTDVAVPVSVYKNPGFCALIATPVFDSDKLEFVKAELALDSGSLEYADNVVFLTDPDFAEDGEIIYLVFRIKDSAVAGEVLPVSLTYKEGDISNREEQDVNFTIVDGSITVKGSRPPVEEATMTVGTAEGKVGDTVDVTVAVDKNPGISAMQIGFDYDKTVLELIGVTPTPVFGGESEFWTDFVWLADGSFDGNGEIFTLQFRILDGAVEGETYPVTVVPGMICNYDEDIVDFEIVAGGVTILHTHVYTAVVTEPGCVAQGYTTYTCECGDSYVSDFTDALGHDFGEFEVTVEPTCTVGGAQVRTCARCGYEEEEAIDPLGHDYVAVVTEPTCTTGGYTTYTCSRCGDNYVADETGELGHDYVAVVTEPTCTTGGYTTYTCSRCGDNYVGDETGELGHDFGEWQVTTEPTCTEPGEETRTCSRCDAFETQPVDAKGHDYVATVVAPTCTAGGYTEHVCSRCGDKYTDSETPELGHDYVATVVAPTCTAGGYTEHVCSRCGDKYTDSETSALGHDWDEGEVTTEPTETAEGVMTYTCRRCGETKTEPIAKLPVDVTKKFKDVDPSMWSAPAIQYVFDQGLMVGVSDDEFDPEGEMTRGMIITVIWKMEGKPAAAGKAPFKDLTEDWYKTAANWGYENGIILGYSDDIYAPGQAVTREQLCAILFRYANFKGRNTSARGSLSGFGDASKVSPYAQDAVSWAVGSGIIKGSNDYGKLYLRPADNATREQVAAVLMRYNTMD